MVEHDQLGDSRPELPESGTINDEMSDRPGVETGIAQKSHDLIRIPNESLSKVEFPAYYNGNREISIKYPCFRSRIKRPGTTQAIVDFYIPFPEKESPEKEAKEPEAANDLQNKDVNINVIYLIKPLPLFMLNTDRPKFQQNTRFYVASLEDRETVKARLGVEEKKRFQDSIDKGRVPLIEVDPEDNNRILFQVSEANEKYAKSLMEPPSPPKSIETSPILPSKPEIPSQPEKAEVTPQGIFKLMDGLAQAATAPESEQAFLNDTLEKLITNFKDKAEVKVLENLKNLLDLSQEHQRLYFRLPDNYRKLVNNARFSVHQYQLLEKLRNPGDSLVHNLPEPIVQSLLSIQDASQLPDIELRILSDGISTLQSELSTSYPHSKIFPTLEAFDTLVRRAYTHRDDHLYFPQEESTEAKSQRVKVYLNMEHVTDYSHSESQAS